MASRARKNSSQFIAAGDCFRLPFVSSSFDAVFSSFVVDLFDEAGQRNVVGEFYRVVKPSGYLVLVNNTRGRGVFFVISGFYVLLSRFFPGILLNKPIDTSSLVERSGCFRVLKRKYETGRGDSILM